MGSAVGPGGPPEPLPHRQSRHGGSAFLVFWAIDGGSLIGFAAAHTLALAGFLAMGYGPMAAMYAELFSTRLRYSGASLGYQGGAILGGALGPIISVALFDATGTSMSIAVYVLAMALLSFACMYALTDTRTVDFHADTPVGASA